MMLRSAINITHIPEEQVAYRQCTRPSLPPAKAWLREATTARAISAQCVTQVHAIAFLVVTGTSILYTSGKIISLK